MTSKQAALRYCTLKFQVLRLRNPMTGDTMLVNALLDNGSNVTMAHDGIAKKWGLTGLSKPLKSHGIGGIVHTADTMMSLVTIETLNGKITTTNPMRFQAQPVGKLPFLDWREYLRGHPEFADVKLPEPAIVGPGEPEVQLLIGLRL